MLHTLCSETGLAPVSPALHCHLPVLRSPAPCLCPSSLNPSFLCPRLQAGCQMKWLCVQDHKLYAAANQTATEAFTSIRTVAAFSLGPFLSAQYCQGMQGPRRAGVIKANTAGGSFGTSQFVLYASYGELAFASQQLCRLGCKCGPLCLTLGCMPGRIASPSTGRTVQHAQMYSLDSSPGFCMWVCRSLTCERCCAGLIFWYGGQLIKDREITLTELLKASYCSRQCEA